MTSQIVILLAMLAVGANVVLSKIGHQLDASPSLTLCLKSPCSSDFIYHRMIFGAAI